MEGVTVINDGILTNYQLVVSSLTDCSRVNAGRIWLWQASWHLCCGLRGDCGPECKQHHESQVRTCVWPPVFSSLTCHVWVLPILTLDPMFGIYSHKTSGSTLPSFKVKLKTVLFSRYFRSSSEATSLIRNCISVCVCVCVRVYVCVLMLMCVYWFASFICLLVKLLCVCLTIICK